MFLNLPVGWLMSSSSTSFENQCVLSPGWICRDSRGAISRGQISTSSTSVLAWVRNEYLKQDIKWTERRQTDTVGWICSLLKPPPVLRPTWQEEWSHMGQQKVWKKSHQKRFFGAVNGAFTWTLLLKLMVDTIVCIHQSWLCQLETQRVAQREGFNEGEGHDFYLWKRKLLRCWNNSLKGKDFQCWSILPTKARIQKACIFRWFLRHNKLGNISISYLLAFRTFPKCRCHGTWRSRANSLGLRQWFIYEKMPGSSLTRRGCFKTTKIREHGSRRRTCKSVAWISRICLRRGSQNYSGGNTSWSSMGWATCAILETSSLHSQEDWLERCPSQCSRNYSSACFTASGDSGCQESTYWYCAKFVCRDAGSFAFLGSSMAFAFFSWAICDRVGSERMGARYHAKSTGSSCK